MRALFVLLALAACGGDETVAAYGGAGSWELRELDGVAADGLSLTFGANGEVSGEAPCNLLNGTQTAPYPWFELSGLAVTRRACPDLAREEALIARLTAMSISEVSGDVLILSDPEAGEMTFARVP
ncbi:META domain-containing protein [Aestuariibius sp. 2305UL40-4]|uniref:META domain-containing protein n=1 Tax=Aestuariibius violaceus TaxID=3234132 RepID=UPI00345F0F81